MPTDMQHAYYSAEAERTVLPTVQIHRETGERVTFFSRTKEWAEENIMWADLQYIGLRNVYEYKTELTGNFDLCSYYDLGENDGY